MNIMRLKPESSYVHISFYYDCSWSLTLMTPISLETMSSILDHLVPLLNGMNYHDWSVLMQLYLQMQELWEVVNRTEGMLYQLQPTTHTTDTGPNTITIAIPVSDNFMAMYHAEYSA